MDRSEILLETKRQIIAGVLAAQQQGVRCLMPRYFALEFEGHLDWEPITPSDVRDFQSRRDDARQFLGLNTEH